MKGRFFMGEETTKKHKKNVVVKKAVSLETFCLFSDILLNIWTYGEKNGNTAYV